MSAGKKAKASVKASVESAGAALENEYAFRLLSLDQGAVARLEGAP